MSFFSPFCFNNCFGITFTFSDLNDALIPLKKEPKLFDTLIVAGPASGETLDDDEPSWHGVDLVTGRFSGWADHIKGSVPGC